MTVTKMKLSARLVGMIACIILMLSFTLIHAYPSSPIQEKPGFTEVDLVIRANGVDIGGTLTLPAQPKTNALVIMSSGSGQQDRDETLDGFKIFRGIAEHLGSEGIASFRFDDRGVGASTGDFVNSTLDDLSADIDGVMDFFTSHEDHPFSEFILFGHSMGGIVVGHTAVAHPDVKQVILMAAPAVPLMDVIFFQIREEYAGIEIDKALIEAEVSAHNRLMSAISNGEDLTEVLQGFYDHTLAVLSALPPHQTLSPEEVEAMARDKTKEFEIVYELPSIASFLYHDPASSYEQLQVQVLGLFGGKDLQVTIDQSKDSLEKALLRAPTSYHLATFHHANHYFQRAETGQRDEYGQLDKAFVEGFLDEISSWILSH